MVFDTHRMIRIVRLENRWRDRRDFRGPMTFDYGTVVETVVFLLVTRLPAGATVLPLV
jgi:hypothetical protein